MTARLLALVLIGVVALSALATPLSPTPTATASPSVSPAESPATLVESVSELSAQRVATERSKIYQQGVDYSKCLNQVPKDSATASFHRRIFVLFTLFLFILSV